jgi:hypothetical protein
MAVGIGSATELTNRRVMRLTCSRNSSRIFASSKIDSYTRVDDMDFLRALLDPELFGEDN